MKRLEGVAMDENSKFWREVGGKKADWYWNLPNIRGKQLVEYFKDKDVKNIKSI